MKFQENKSIVDKEEEESFRAIFPRGSRWLGLGRSGCKVAEETIEICKSGERTGGGGKEEDRSGGNGANVLSERNTYTSRFLELLSLLSSLLYLSLSELAVETAIIKLWSRS